MRQKRKEVREMGLARSDPELFNRLAGGDPHAEGDRLQMEEEAGRGREWDCGSFDSGRGRFWNRIAVREAGVAGRASFQVLQVRYDRAAGMRKIETILETHPNLKRARARAWEISKGAGVRGVEPKRSTPPEGGPR